MKNYIFITFSLLISGTLMSQKSPWGNSNQWKSNKTEFYMQIGATQFMGDVGGADEIGTPRSLRDMNISSTRMGVGAGFRFRLNARLATSTQLYVGMLSGSDKNTEEIARSSRNLMFRSPIIELSQRLEFIIYADEKESAIYLGGGGRPRADNLYVFSGISGFFFNPQTRLDGKWVNLIPLKTEGQGLEGGAKKYLPVSVSIPFGIGFKMAITDLWRIGIEASYNKTFTDYIDDVSTRYYNPNILLEEVGEDAVRAANPSIENQDWFFEGEKRGNPDDKDAYFFLNLTVTKNITGGSNKRTKWNKL